MNAHEDNDKTLASYEEHLLEYIDGTPRVVSGEAKVWLNSILETVPLTSRILEIGSAFGRDAAYIESMGYKVERTDAAKSFVQYLQKDHPVRELNILKDDITDMFNIIFADAVFLHFNEQEFNTATTKIFNAISEGGIFGLTLKKGDGEEWSEEKLGSPRFFHYWQPEDVRAVLTSVGFAEVNIKNYDPKWLHIIARK